MILKFSSNPSDSVVTGEQKKDAGRSCKWRQACSQRWQGSSPQQEENSPTVSKPVEQNRSCGSSRFGHQPSDHETSPKWWGKSKVNPQDWFAMKDLLAYMFQSRIKILGLSLDDAPGSMSWVWWRSQVKLAWAIQDISVLRTMTVNTSRRWLTLSKIYIHSWKHIIPSTRCGEGKDWVDLLV